MSLFIFDLDGTLLDTLQDLANSGNYALQQHGFTPHAKDRYKMFVGNGVQKLIERALPPEANGAEIRDKVLDTFLQHYDKHGQELTAPYPGIVTLLQQLQAQDHRISVASNKYHKAVLALVPFYFPEIHFDLVLGHRDGHPPKPDPDIVFDTLSTLKVDPEDCFYLGDSSVDMLTAKQAGVRAIGVTWGFRTEDELRQNGADLIIHRPEELWEYIH